ncbi:hypothetical protein ACQPZP_37390 [Spirillospora sp. CA-142024]|uniref:hypothetical protein n=1 Tax=Spirillospora sp. CA-142024 TaxID=3240036 RepID=UPI003D8BEE11
MSAESDGRFDYVAFADELAGMIEGYPLLGPEYTLAVISLGVAKEAGERHGNAMLVAAWSARWYVEFEFTAAGDFDYLIEGAERAEQVLRASGCTVPGEHRHPPLVDIEPEDAGAIAAVIGDAEAWAASEPGYEMLSPAEIDAWTCPGFLADLAAELAKDLRGARRRRFEVPATEHLDARFLVDGRLQAGALLTDLGQQESRSIDPTAQAASIWACRRLLGNPPVEERTPLALAVCFMLDASRWGSPAPGVLLLYREALRSFDLSALDQPCSHPDGHPGVDVKDTLEHIGDQEAGVDPHGARCPRRTAELVRETFTDITRHLDPYDEELDD